MSNIRLTSLSQFPTGPRFPARATGRVLPLPGWLGEVGFCAAFLAVLAAVWLA